MENKIEHLAEILKNSNNIVFFGGAGMSTESRYKDLVCSHVPPAKLVA